VCNGVKGGVEWLPLDGRGVLLSWRRAAQMASSSSRGKSPLNGKKGEKEGKSGEKR